MKFGGTSVGTGAMIKNAIGIITQNTDRDPIVVVSAFSKATDLLLKATREAERGNFEEAFKAVEERHFLILEELDIDKSLIEDELREARKALSKISSQLKCTKKDADVVASFGERLSTKIVAEFGTRNDLRMQNYNSYDLGMVTDDNFGRAEILPETYSALREGFSRLPKGQIPVVTGYIAKNKRGEITTLGRGGSDYTAAIIGASVGAEEVQIWTDVDGVMTADPRIVNSAMTIPQVSFDEISELAYFGAKVLHPKTIIPVMNKNIKVRVLNTYNPSGSGTVIVSERKNGQPAITSIACKKGISVVNINSARMFLMHGFLHKIFKIFDDHKVSVDMISTSEVSVSVTIDNKNGDLEALHRDLSAIADISVEMNKASVNVVGSSIKRTPGVSAKVFASLAARNINVEMISQGASEINLGFVVDEQAADTAVSALHEVFFEVKKNGS